jgi:uncharacterized protein with FMN-binding domain
MKKQFTNGMILISLFFYGLLHFSGCASREMMRVRAMPIHNVDLSRIPNGIFNGGFTYADFTYEVAVYISNHRITDVKILSNRDTKYAKKAEGVIERVLQAQSPKVDAISGATTTSKAILKAIENALTETFIRTQGSGCLPGK